jgi:hypothetical protein
VLDLCPATINCAEPAETPAADDRRFSEAESAKDLIGQGHRCVHRHAGQLGTLAP